MLVRFFLNCCVWPEEKRERETTREEVESSSGSSVSRSSSNFTRRRQEEKRNIGKRKKTSGDIKQPSTYIHRAQEIINSNCVGLGREKLFVFFSIFLKVLLWGDGQARPPGS